MQYILSTKPNKEYMAESRSRTRGMRIEKCQIRENVYEYFLSIAQPKQNYQRKVKFIIRFKKESFLDFSTPRGLERISS